MPASSGAASQWGSRAVHVMTRLGNIFRRVAGMPDYLGYLQHLRSCHPEMRVPTQQEFYSEFVRSRYGDGPTRCC